jgi:hypothetical protein
MNELYNELKAEANGFFNAGEFDSAIYVYGEAIPYASNDE